MRLLLVAIAILTLTGCAMRQSAPMADFVPCIPPDISPMSEWGMYESAEARLLHDQAGGTMKVVAVTFKTPKGQIRVWLTETMSVVGIDPAPDDPNVKILYDDGLLDASGLVIPDGTPSCHWKTLSGPSA